MNMVGEGAGCLIAGLLIDDDLPELRRLINVPLYFKHYAMKTYGGVDTKIHVFLTSAFCGAQ
jgi:hypothetical protein